MSESEGQTDSSDLNEEEDDEQVDDIEEEADEADEEAKAFFGSIEEEGEGNEAIDGSVSINQPPAPPILEEPPPIISSRKDLVEDEEDEDDDEEEDTEEETDTEQKVPEIQLSPEELAALAEAQRIFEANEEVKEIIRAELRELKVDFRALAQNNDEILAIFRLPRSEFEMDPRIKQSRNAHNQSLIEDVYNRHLWNGIRSIIASDKIQQHFLDEIAAHYEEVKDLENSTYVHTFRQRVITSDFWDLYRQNNGWIVDEQLLLAAGAPEKVTKDLGQAPVPVKRLHAKDLIGEYEGKVYDIKTTHAIRQLEDRLLRKYLRECEWLELNSQKVPDDYEDPEDLNAIKSANDTMGKYHLKTAPDYTGELITTAERRKRIMDHKVDIHDELNKFNHHIQQLKDEKAAMIEKCRQFETEILERHKYMPTDARVPVPVVSDKYNPGVSPTKIFHISEEDITEQQNQKLEAAGLLKRKIETFGEDTETPIADFNLSAKTSTKKRKRIYREGDFLRGRNDPRAPPVELRQLQQSYVVVSRKQMKTFGRRKDLEGLSLAVFKYRKAFMNPKTEAALRRRDRILARRTFERDYYLDKLKQLIEYFRNRVISVRNERIDLQLDLHLMNISLLISFQELHIAKDFDTAETNVLERFKAQRAELKEAKKRADKMDRQLHQAKRDHHRVAHNLNKLVKEVTAYIEDQGKFSEYLWKVFRKRLMSDGTSETEEGTGVSTPESHNSSSSGSKIDLLKAAKTKLNVNVCPPNLDQDVYNKVCDFRQKKAHLEEDLQTNTQIVDKLTEDWHLATGLFEKFEGRVMHIEKEISALRHQRQVMINNLKNLVILKADQIQCIDESHIEMDSGPIIDRIKRHFPDINKVIVYPKDGTVKLNERIKDLQDEIKLEHRKEQLGRLMIVRLREELQKKENRVTELMEKCRHDMTARFGRIIDMEDIIACIINLEMLDALVALEQLRKNNYRERDRVNGEVKSIRTDMAKAINVNSEFNTLLTILEERQRDVDYFLYKQDKYENQRAAELRRSSSLVGTDSSASFSKAEPNEDVLNDMYDLELAVIAQLNHIASLREAIAAAKIKAGIPPILVMTSIPDTIGEKFLTFRELQEFKSMLNAEVEVLFNKGNTSELLHSNSAFPTSTANSQLLQPESSMEFATDEHRILAQLDQRQRDHPNQRLSVKSHQEIHNPNGMQKRQSHDPFSIEQKYDIASHETLETGGNLRKTEFKNDTIDMSEIGKILSELDE